MKCKKSGKVGGNKYAQVPRETLDLHGYTAAQARSAADVFLKNTRNTGGGLVRIITGKGSRTGGVSVVKETVKQLLAAQKLNYRYAKQAEGGDGVLLVTV